MDQPHSKESLRFRTIWPSAQPAATAEPDGDRLLAAAKVFCVKAWIPPFGDGVIEEVFIAEEPVTDPVFTIALPLGMCGTTVRLI